MLKIFQTGDNHIGKKYAKYTAKGIITDLRKNAFENMVDIANKENCDLFVITGDLFDNHKVAKKDVKCIVDYLSHFDGTVVVIPGNHDWYDSSEESHGIWDDFINFSEENCHDNIVLLKENKPYEITVRDDTAVLYPAFCPSLHSSPGENNLGWIKNTVINNDKNYHIGIAHGSIKGVSPDMKEEYFVMEPTELEKIPVDAWLIGHTHIPYPSDLSEEEYSKVHKVFNAGAHTQEDVSNNTEGYCFIIKIDDEKNVFAKKVKTGNVFFKRIELQVNAGSFESDVENALKDIPPCSVVDLGLFGAIYDDEYKNRYETVELKLERFIEYRLNYDNLSKLITDDLIDSEFNELTVSSKLLKRLISNPKEAQLAYDLIKSLK